MLVGFVMSNQKVITVDPLSASSLRVQAEVNNNSLSTATGFVVDYKSNHYLITNWHVVTGKNPETNQTLSPTAGIPDTLKIVHHSTSKLGSWVIKSEALLENGNPKWIEHPSGRDVDVVALPLTHHNDVKFYPFDLGLAQFDMVPEPAMPISIIGYPYGLATGGAWPIWKTGHIASDPDLDYDGKPVFLIDATTRGGMSGSPVVLRLHGGYKTSNGSYVMSGGTSTKFLGVYSGRIHGQAEIGRVWRPNLIDEILQQV